MDLKVFNLDVFVETFQPEKYQISVQKIYIQTHQEDPLEKQGKNTWGRISNRSSQQIIFLGFQLIQGYSIKVFVQCAPMVVAYVNIRKQGDEQSRQKSGGRKGKMG